MSLTISIIVAILHLLKYLNERFNIIIEYDKYFCFFIDPIYTAYGNDNSMVLSVRIVNLSVYPITISKVNMLGGKSTGGSTAQCPAGYIEHLSYQYDNGESIVTLNISDEQIKLPLKLNPFEEVYGYFIFPFAFAQYFIKSKNHSTKWYVQYSTSRGNKITKCYILDRGYLEERQ